MLPGCACAAGADSTSVASTAASCHDDMVMVTGILTGVRPDDENACAAHSSHD